MNRQTLQFPSHPSRRRFLQETAAASAVLFKPCAAIAVASENNSFPPAFSTLKPLGSRVRPFLAEEFRERLLRAQQFMSEPPSSVASRSPATKYSALFLAP